MRIQKQPFLCKGGPMHDIVLFLDDHTGRSGTLPISLAQTKGRYVSKGERSKERNNYLILQWEPL